jgi:hypothetical protein
VLRAAVVIATGDFAAKETGFWRLLVPGVVMGSLMYTSKRLHVGHPLLVFPLLVGGPVLIFHIARVAMGMSLDDTRAAGACWAGLDDAMTCALSHC